MKVNVNIFLRKENRDKDLVKRAKFVRICIEIDLKKKLLSEFKLIRSIYHIEYKSLHLICFNCDKYGYKEELCPKLLLGKMNIDELAIMHAIKNEKISEKYEFG